jgi:hypothetical protein
MTKLIVVNNGFVVYSDREILVNDTFFFLDSNGNIAKWGDGEIRYRVEWFYGNDIIRDSRISFRADSWKWS